MVPESSEVLALQAHQFLQLVAQLSNRPYQPGEVGDRIPALDSALARAEGVLRRLAGGADKLRDQDAHSRSRRQGLNSPTSAPDTFALLADVLDLRNRLLMHQLSDRHEVVHRMNLALQRLRSVESVQEFVDQVPVEVVNLGYVRSLYSSAERMQWMARSAHSTQGTREGQLLLEAGRQDPLRDLHDLYEAEMVQERHPILRRGIRKSRRVHPEIIKVTESDSYVASPLILGGRTRAFVSVDVNVESGTVDEFDMELMGLFTTGAAIPGTETAAVADSSEGGAPHPGLTRREREILDLVAQGLSNADIAQRLVISKGTAKTHVRNILRKLGASNRTQAAAFLRQE